MIAQEKSTVKGCCPLFIPEKWDNRTFEWKRKPFIKETIPTLFHIPFPPMIGRKVTKMMTLAEEADRLSSDLSDTLLLFNDPSAFKTVLLLSVTAPVPEAHNITLSGIFHSRFLEGSYRDVVKFMKETEQELRRSGNEVKDFYVHYAYCPKCAKKYGHNYMVLFAETGNHK